MDSAARPRSTRDRPAKAPLSEDAILGVALRILRAEGLEAVTMRRLAGELDTGPASLYVYLAGRDELRNAMLDRVVGLIALEAPDPPRWRDQVHGLLRRLLEVMEAHPGIAQVAVANPPVGERTMLVADNLLGLLLAGGVRPQDAGWACDILPLITTASAVETDVYRQRGQDTAAHESEMVDQLSNVFANLSRERFPHITAYAAELTSGDGRQRFDFAIDVFLDGLVARAQRG